MGIESATVTLRIRRVRHQFGAVLLQRARFPAERFAYRSAKTRVGQIVERSRFRRQEPARELVLALRAGFERLEAVRQAILDSLVIARLKMEPRHVFQTTPVAAVKRGRRAQEQRHRNDRAAAPAQHRDDLARQGCAKMTKETESQRRMVAALFERVQVKLVDCTPFPGTDLIAVAKFAGDAGARDLCAFVTDVLALLVRQCSEKVFEIAPAGTVGVRPMVLPVEAREPARVRQRLRVDSADEIDVGRRQFSAFDGRQDRLDEEWTKRCRVGTAPRSLGAAEKRQDD